MPEGPALHAACATASAATAACATNPVDVIKTRIMNDHANAYKGPLDCARRTLAAEGPAAFYKGLGATFARLLPHTVVMWLVQEQVLRAIAGAGGGGR